MSEIYSERLVMNFGAGTWTEYRVPDGRRAVIRCLTLVNSGTEATAAIVTAGPSTIFADSIPGGTTRVIGDLRHVAYAGENVNAYMASPTAQLCVSGYVFRDATGRQAAPGAEAPGRLPALGAEFERSP